MSTCVFMSLQSEERIRTIQREDADVVVVAAGGDEPAWVRLIGGNDAHAGHVVGVAVHAVHLRVAPVLTTEPEITEKETTQFIQLFPVLYYSKTFSLLLLLN